MTDPDDRVRRATDHREPEEDEPRKINPFMTMGVVLVAFYGALAVAWLIWRTM